jgi:hypothetical protein
VLPALLLTARNEPASFSTASTRVLKQHNGEVTDRSLRSAADLQQRHRWPQLSL